MINFKKDYKKFGIRIIKFNGSCGILRCNYLEKDNIIKLLNSNEKFDLKYGSIKTIATSGTIKSLINKHLSKYL